MHNIKINDLELEVGNLYMEGDSEGKLITFDLTTEMDGEKSIALSQLCLDTLIKNKKVKVSINNHDFEEEFFLNSLISEDGKERHIHIELYTL